MSKMRYTVGCFTSIVGILMWIFSGFLSAETQLTHQGKWRILIVAESGDLGLRAGHPAYKRANNAIFSQLQRAGFGVLSLAADKTFPLCLMDVCKQQTEQDIIALANKSSSDIDLVILFGVRYIERVGAGIIHREISVPSRMIDVKTGRRVGLWDDDGVLTEPIPVDCIDRCLQSALSDYARQIGRDSGLAIAIKLQEYQRWYDYHLTFLKFAKGELHSFEQYFQNSFKNNFIRGGSNTVDKESQNQVLLHSVVNREIVIESLLSPLYFRQSLEQILDDEGLRANIQKNGYEFILHREGLPYLWRYIITAFLLLVFLMASYFRYVRYQHNKVLARLLSMKRQLVEQSLVKASEENPYPLLMKVDKLLNRVNGGRGIQQQKNDVNVARMTFINALPVLTGQSIIKSEGLAVNVLTDDEVRIGRHNANNSANDRPDVKPDVKRSDTENHGGNIAIGFTRLSHIGKQNKIERLQDGFTLVDEGSSNGSFLDDVLTVVDQPVSLPLSEHVLCLGGSRDPLEPGVCQLRFYVKKAKASSLIIEIDREAIALAELSMLNENWPNLAYDQTQQWLLLGVALDIGIDSAGDLDIGCLRGAQALVTLSYFNQTTTPQGRCPGYWLEPVAGQPGKPIDIYVNQTPVFTAVPLILGANVSIAGTVFSFISVPPKKAL